jgi:serine/threonine protein phosphatase PrpC
MEDTVSVTTPLDEDDDHTGLFAVFDGHAGT